MKFKLYVTESPMLSASRGQLRLVASNGIVLEDSLAKMPTQQKNAKKKREIEPSIKVECSSWISEIKYDEDAKILSVVTNSEKVYNYKNVNKITYERFQNSPSKGRFFARHIRKRFDRKAA